MAHVDMREQYTVEEVMTWHIEDLQRTFTQLVIAGQAAISNAVAIRDSIGIAVG